MNNGSRDKEPVTWGELEPVMAAVKTELDEVRDTSNQALKVSKEAISISKEALKTSKEAIRISKEALNTANKSLRVSESILKVVESIDGKMKDQKQLEDLPRRMTRAEDDIIRLKARTR